MEYLRMSGKGGINAGERRYGRKHAISAETGKEGAESEEFITDNSAPKLTVNYEGVLNIMDKDSAIWNINETLHNNEGKVTSSQNQILWKGEWNFYMYRRR